MSAPDTNIETQEKRHKGPLSGMFIGVMVAGVMFLGLMIWLVWNGNDPGEDTPAAAESTTDTGTAPLVEPVTID